jgi:hypothetical protein
MFVKVQDVKYAVRVIEEGGGPLEFVHYTNEEDQIGRSMVESSCDSVEIGPAAAMVDEGLSDGFDSDGSEQQEGAGTLKTVHDNRVDLSLLKSNTMEPFDNTVSATPIPSNGSEYKTKGEDNMVQVEGEESTMVRGMSTSPGDDQGRGVDLGMSAGLFYHLLTQAQLFLKVDRVKAVWSFIGGWARYPTIWCVRVLGL